MMYSNLDGLLEDVNLQAGPKQQPSSRNMPFRDLLLGLKTTGSFCHAVFEYTKIWGTIIPSVRFMEPDPDEQCPKAP